MALGQKILKVGIEINGSIGRGLDAAIRQTRAKIGGLGTALNDVGGAGKAGLGRVLAAPLWQGAAAGAAGIGLAMAASVKAAGQFEQSLTDISKTAGLGATETKALGAEILKLTASDKTNQSAEKLAAGIKTLVGSGLALKDAQAAILGIGRVATATGSEITEVADTSYQLMQNLGIRAADVGRTFEVLAAAGKQGSFELKDMAREFPKVASSAQKLGIGGTKGAASLAAMLQVVRRGASDSSTAANNLVNLLEKITGKDAVKNFKKFGVNIEQVVKGAQAKGLNPLEESIKAIQKITKGDPFKVNELFGDMQVKAALAPLMKDFKDFERIRDESLRATGVIDEDYAKQLDTFTERMNGLRNATNRLGIATGNALMPALTDLAKALTPLMEGFGKFASENPRLASSLILVAGAFAGLVAAAPGLAALGSGLGAVKAILAGGNLAGLIAGWLPWIVGAGQALLALITGPIGLTVLAVVGIGAALVWAYQKVGWFRDGVDAAWVAIQQGWAQARQVFAAIGRGVQFLAGVWLQALGGIVQAWRGLGQLLVGIFTLDAAKIQQGFQNLWAGAGTVFNAIGRGWRAIGGVLAQVAGVAVAAIAQWFAQLPGRLAAVWQLLVQGAGMAWNATREGAGRLIQGLVGLFQTLPQRLGGVFLALGQGLLDGVRRGAGAAWGLLTGGGAPAPAMAPPATAPPAARGPAPAQPANNIRPIPRAYGGPVRPGVDYLVGERRAEVVQFGATGRVTPSIQDYLAAQGQRAQARGQAPGITISPGAVQVNVGSGDPAEIQAAVDRALRQFRFDLESSYRSFLSD